MGGEPAAEVSITLGRDLAVDGRLRPGDTVDVFATEDETTLAATGLRVVAVTEAGGSFGDGSELTVTMALPDPADGAPIIQAAGGPGHARTHHPCRAGHCVVLRPRRRGLMATRRYVVLGLAGVRAAWFADVARWATSATIPVDFVKVVSREEARARLLAGRTFSAMVVDAGLGALDRDLVDVAVSQGCAVVAAEDARTPRSWHDLGVQRSFPSGSAPTTCSTCCGRWRGPSARADDLAAPTTPAPLPGPADRVGRLVAVTGAGGVGRSMLAAALAAGLAGDPATAAWSSSPTWPCTPNRRCCTTPATWFPACSS